MKRWLSMALCLVMLLAVIPFAGIAATETDAQLQYPKQFMVSQTMAASTERLEDYVDIATFQSYLVEKLANCPTSVDISSFKIPNTGDLSTQVANFIWYRTPEAFHVYGLAVSGGSKLTSVSVSYRSEYNTASKYQSARAEFMAGAQELLSGVEYNNNLTDVEKALILHDRLAIWAEYSYKELLSNTLSGCDFTAYGIFAKQKGVCQAYAMAYMYLLDRVGIANEYCDSYEMNHAWNIVYINGKPYHVDVTWDDPVWDRTGYVGHKNFLRSTNGFKATEHNGTDYLTTPTDTTYDNYYWQSVDSAFQVIGHDLFYIDDTEDVIKKVDGNTRTTVCSVGDKWYISSTGYWSDLGCLASAGDKLLYSKSKSVYVLDPKTGTSTVIFTPNTSSNAYLSIYGFKYEKNYLICDMATTYIQDEHVKDNQVTKYYKPTSLTYTVTFKNWDGSVLSTGTYHAGDTVTPPAAPTRPDDAEYTYTFAGWDKAVLVCNGDAVYTATYIASKKDGGSAKNGWFEVNGVWYYFENDVMVKNDWRKDSVGWCFLTADGSMAVDTFVKDSVGYAYVDKGGYYYETVNGWRLVSGVWYYLEKGYCVRNDWRKDSTGWCFLTADGSMAVNTFVKDSVGWAYVDASGYYYEITDWKLIGGKWYFLEKGYSVRNQWRKDSKGWCWLTDTGAMATNQWVQDSKGWCYIGADGYCWTNCWAKDSTGWVWLDKEGSMVYSKWIQDGGKWYYVGAEGYKLTNTTWNGYIFDANGVCQNP